MALLEIFVSIYLDYTALWSWQGVNLSPWVRGGLQSQCTILLRFGLQELLVGAVDRVPGRPAVLQASLESELVRN